MPANASQTKIVVTGASGLLGRSVMRILARREDISLVGLAYSRSGKSLERIDLTSDSDIDSLFAEHAPQIVVHCAAERRPDVSEKDPDATTKLNVDSTRLLAEACKRNGAWLLYLSTDYVFDGANPPYSPSAPVNPLNHYGTTKLAGERVARETLSDALILRVPVLFGRVESLAESAVTTIASAVQSSKPQKLDHWAIRYPTFTDDVAQVIEQLIDRKLAYPDFGGTYHWSGDESFTKYDMALVIANVWEVSSAHLKPDANEPSGAPRPKDCHLDSSALEELGIGHRTPFAQAIEIALEAFRPANR